MTTRSFFQRAINSPMTAICLVAIAVISLFAVLWLNPKLKFTSNPPPKVQKAVDSPDNSALATTSILTEAEQTSVDSEAVVVPPTESEVDLEISALEPENTDLPLAYSPTPAVNPADEASEPLATTAVPLVTKTVKIDVESKMAQKILLYRQPKVSRRVLIDALQEQLGVPIRYNVDELGETSLEDKVTFELENTTLGAIMKRVADTAGWQVIAEDTGIRLTKKQ